MNCGAHINMIASGSVKPRSPSDLSPKWWLRADAAEITLVGDDVSVWLDRTANNHDCSETSARPKWIAEHAALNNRPAVEFASGEGMATIAGVESVSDWTILGVFDVPALAAAACWLVDGSATLQPALRNNDAAKDLGYYDGAWHDIAAPITGPQSIIWRLEQGANEGRIYRNGVNLGASTYAATKTPLHASGGYLLVGHTGFTVYLADLLAIPSAVDAMDLAFLMAYTLGRYGV